MDRESRTKLSCLDIYLKLEWWIISQGCVEVRANFDVENGSAIAAQGKNLAEALENLAQAIRSTNLEHLVWQDKRIR